MNVNQLINTMNNTHLTPSERTGAAAKLWEIQNRMAKSLKKFKADLSDLSDQEGKDLWVTSSDKMYITCVERQPPTPQIGALDPEEVRQVLGDNLFDQYIAHSYTIRWSEFKLAPEEVKEKFYNIPGINMTQTYQVKFKRSDPIKDHGEKR
jgi:hypothetical protein